jgi:hypothetical protein
MLKKIMIFYFATFMSPTYAHEFWLQPHTYRAMEGDDIQVNWRVGMDFQGKSSAYIPDMSTYVGTFQKGGLVALEPRFAAKPALTFEASAGTTIGITESADFIVEYEDYDAFFAFIEKENLYDQLVTSTQPPTGKTFESYRRFTKTLISTEPQTWKDSLVGLDFEWLLTRKDNNLSGTLYIDNKPAANYPVKLFSKATQTSRASVREVKTDDNGGVLFDNLDADYIYLINAIKMRPSAPSDKFERAQWHTDWASTTFQW